MDANNPNRTQIIGRDVSNIFHWKICKNLTKT